LSSNGTGREKYLVEPEEVRKEDEQPSVMNIHNPPYVNCPSQPSLRREVSTEERRRDEAKET
jgi:hypothetical protein